LGHSRRPGEKNGVKVDGCLDENDYHYMIAFCKVNLSLTVILETILPNLLWERFTVVVLMVAYAA
jgi:hypothetical protein